MTTQGETIQRREFVHTEESPTVPLAESLNLGLIERLEMLPTSRSGSDAGVPMNVILSQDGSNSVIASRSHED